MKQTIGIDIGASKIIFVLLKDKKLVKDIRIKTPKTKTLLIRALKDNLKKFPKVKIGIGIPGKIKGKTIKYCPNLKYLNNTNLEKELKKNIVLENDANCFVLAEAIMGNYKGTVLGITLGSGLGSGLVKNQKIKGNLELGHIKIKAKGRRCTCGKKGCLEEYASAKFLKRNKTYKELGKNLNIGLNKAKIKADIIILGGGIARSHKYFLKEIKRDVKISKLGEKAGAIGAALLVQ